MGILDEAIKEHLELKRQHGAGESELQRLEDEAFGAAERPGAEELSPDALAEAPTAFMAQPDPGAAQETGTAGSEAPEDELSAPEAGEAPARRRTEIADLQEPPPPEPSAEPEPEAPAEEEAPAMEHEAIAEPQAESEPQPEETEPTPTPSTEERQAIAEQPTEMYDVEEELADSESHAPSDEALVEEELGEPRLAPVDPLAEVEEADDDALEVSSGDLDDADLDDEFWDEKRLSDELDQALEAPRETETEVTEPLAEEGAEPAVEDEGDWEESPRGSDEDVLEETPDFLEEAPEDDQLWFEQKPPKDFDFDD